MWPIFCPDTPADVSGFPTCPILLRIYIYIAVDHQIIYTLKLTENRIRIVFVSIHFVLVSNPSEHTWHIQYLYKNKPNGYWYNIQNKNRTAEFIVYLNKSDVLRKVELFRFVFSLANQNTVNNNYIINANLSLL